MTEPIRDLTYDAADEDYAINAYNSYGVSVGGTTWDNKPIPAWHEIQERQRSGWRAAVRSVFLGLSEKRDTELRRVEALCFKEPK